MRCRMILVVALSVVILTSCAGSGTTDATELPASVASSTTTVGSPTSTTVPGDVPFPAGEPVDLLVLTDSSGWGIAERYAPLAAEALNREVRVHDFAAGGQSISETLAQIQTSLAEVVAEAEVIVVYGWPGDLASDLPEPGLETCFDAIDAVEYPEEYEGSWVAGEVWQEIPVVATVEDWQPFRGAFDEVFAEIWRLRGGQPTILRTYDVWNGFGVSVWRELGIEEECVANWAAQGQAVSEAAEASGAGFVSLLNLFNGPNHDEDPEDKGWIGEDGAHANEQGQQAAAEALAAIGFEVSKPPQ